MISLESAEKLVAVAVAAATGAHDRLSDALDALPAPIYRTDANGLVTHFNRACIEFAGRLPQPGADRWCVSWKLSTLDGAALPHDECPMALAIRQRRPVRGAEAYAERPDGSRVRFVPFPTPLYDADGAIIGAINLIVDVTDRRRAEELVIQSARCRRLAESIGDHEVGATLRGMADEYDAEAARLRQAH